MELKSVQLLTVPSTAALFAGDGPASGNPDDYTHGPEMPLTGRQAAAAITCCPIFKA